MKREGDTKQKLVKVAAKLIWEQSYGSVSVEDICKEAGVTKGSFYFAFPSKAELIIAALEDYWISKRVVLDAIFSSQEPALSQFDKYCDMVIADQQSKFKEYGKVCGCPVCSLGSELSTQDEKIRRKSEEMMQRSLRYLTGAVVALQAEGLTPKEDPKALARQIGDYVMGLMLEAKIENSLEALNRLKPGVFRILGVKVQALVSIAKAA